VGGANTSGDVTYVDADEIGSIYRSLENVSHKFIDLLDDNARAQLYLDGMPIGDWPYGGPYTIINDSNVAGVPLADPFDHIAAVFKHSSGDRAIVFKPVELP
jgi:hypothetical protein